MTAVTLGTPVARAWSRVWAGRNRYLAGAVCLTICVFMLTPIVLSVLASVKTTAEAAAVPPTYVPHEVSLDSYQRLWSYQAGSADLSLQQLRDGVHDDRVHARPDDPGRLRAGALPGAGQGAASSSSCCWP